MYSSGAPLPLAFFLSGVGSGELVVLFIVVLLLFGPRRLPELARSLGKMMAELRKASDTFRAQIMTLDEDMGSALDEDATERPALPEPDIPPKPGETDDDNRA